MTNNELTRMSIMFDCSRATSQDEVAFLDDDERESLLISYWEQFPDDPNMVDMELHWTRING